MYRALLLVALLAGLVPGGAAASVARNATTVWLTTAHLLTTERGGGSPADLAAAPRAVCSG